MVRTALCISVLAVLVMGASPAFSDKVGDLEQRVMQLEQQNAQLQQQLQQVLEEIRQQREAAPVAPAPAPEEKPAPPVASEFLQKVKIGGDWRLRGKMMDNMWNFDYKDGVYDDSWEWYRMRTRLFADYPMTEDLRFYFRAANEYKWGLGSKANTLLIDPDFDPLIGNKELFLDNAYIDWRKPLGIDYLTLRLGRQDLIYGEGFMILDGQSNVGSMMISFDGIKSSWALGEKTNLDIFTMKIEEHTKQLADDEDLYGVYLTDNSLLENTKLEAYVLHRNKNAVDDYAAAIYNPKTGLPPKGLFLDPVQDTTAIGGRISGSLFDPDFTYAAEAAYQFGNIEDATGFYFSPASKAKGDIDRRAFGGYAWGKYTFSEVAWKPYLKLGGVFTSGDDPDTKKYEGFDTFYAEWPKYSEGLIYQLYDPFIPLKSGTDPDLGSWTNMIIAQAELGFRPMEPMDISLSYQRLWADEETGLGDGDTRGDLFIAFLNYKFNKYLSGHLLGEYFAPDDYYPDDSDDAIFARWQLMLNF